MNDQEQFHKEVLEALATINRRLDKIEARIGLADGPISDYKIRKHVESVVRTGEDRIDLPDAPTDQLKCNGPAKLL